MFHNVSKVQALQDYKLLVTFCDGSLKSYDVSPWFARHAVFCDLKNNDLFSRVQVDGGGFGISWNDEIDLACEELWEHGVPAAPLA